MHLHNGFQQKMILIPIYLKYPHVIKQGASFLGGRRSIFFSFPLGNLEETSENSVGSVHSVHSVGSALSTLKFWKEESFFHRIKVIY